MLCQMSGDLTITIESIIGHHNVRRTEVSSVVNVRGGLFSSFFGKLEKRKSALLTDFQQRYAYAYLWLDDWNADLINEIKGNWETVRENLFHVPQSQVLGSLYKKLYQGKWQFFFSDQPLQQSYDYALFAKGPDDVELLLTRSGAQVVIVSWLDDAEWFIGWQPSTLTIPPIR